MRALLSRTGWKASTIVLSGLLILGGGFPVAGYAQMQTTTGINGTVTDTSGAVVAGATVELKEQNTGAVFHDKTNNSGSYNFPSILPGLYTITATNPGFETQIVTDRRVLATQPATVDIVMHVGRTTQTVTVSAAGAETLTTADQTITGTVTPTLVENLPTVRGNFFDLLTLTPGVVPSTSSGNNGGENLSFVGSAYNLAGTTMNTVVQSGVFVGGNRDSASNVSVDGSNVQDPIYEQTPQLQPTDTVQEMRVQTANMNAEFGYGASGVSVITKSGTNEFHGDVYEYLRNNHLDSNTFFSNQARQKLPTYQQNQFGGSFGGPIVKNKLLFFFNYQGLRVRQTQNIQTTEVPDTYRAGDFSVNANSTPTKPVAPVPIYNPYSFNPVTGLRTQFPGNMIPLGATNLCAPRAQCTSPIDITYLNQWILHPNVVINAVPEFIGTQKAYVNSDGYNGRIDFMKSEKATIYGRFTTTPNSQFNGSYDPLGGTTDSFSSDNVVVHWTESINSNLLNHMFGGFNRPVWLYSRNLNVPDVSKQLGIMNTSTLNGGPDFAGTGYDTDTSGTFDLNPISNSYQLQDDLTYVRGQHTLRFGLSLLDRRMDYIHQSDDKGVFTFTGGWTTACPTGIAACTAAAAAAGESQGGLPWADYLLGATADGGGIQGNYLLINPAPYAGHQLYSGFYAQDSWRVTSRLTVNAGVRYEHWTPFLEPRNITLSLNYANGDPLYRLANPLDYLSASKCYGECAPINPASAGPGSYNTGSLDIAPRLGLAYHILPNTVLRASAGIFYDGNVTGTQLSNIQTGAAPFSLRFQQDVIPNTIAAPVWTVDTMFPLSSGGALAIPKENDSPVDTYRFINPYMPTAAVDQWSFDIEQRLGKVWGLDVSYLGSHTTHEYMYLDANAATLPAAGTPAASKTLQQNRVWPAWGVEGTWLPIGWARYNGLVASFHNTNAWHGLTLISNFQWSSNIVSSHWGDSDEGNQNFRQPYIWQGKYTTAQPGRLVVGYTYNLPVGRGRQFGGNMNRLMDAALGGWMVSGINTFARGGWAPVFNLGPDQTGTGENQMPNRICNPNIIPGGRGYLQWYNPNCFTQASYATNGNSNIQAFTIPGQNNWDVAVSKSLKTGFPKETGRFEIRLDTFNTWNHTQWASPNQYISVWTSTTNGRIGATLPPRQMQMTAKYFF